MEILKEMIRAKLIKLESISDLPDEKIYVKDGEVISGGFDQWPKMDESFVFSRIVTCDRISADGERFSQRLPVITSSVMEIIDSRTFKTRNSIYKIVTLEDERDEKIEVIIK